MKKVASCSQGKKVCICLHVYFVFFSIFFHVALLACKAVKQINVLHVHNPLACYGYFLLGFIHRTDDMGHLRQLKWWKVVELGDPNRIYFNDFLSK